MRLLLLVLQTRYIPQHEVVLIQELATYLSWRQWSKLGLEITKAFVVGMYVNLVWSSKDMKPLLQG